MSRRPNFIQYLYQSKIRNKDGSYSLKRKKKNTAHAFQKYPLGRLFLLAIILLLVLHFFLLRSLWISHSSESDPIAVTASDSKPFFGGGLRQNLARFRIHKQEQKQQQQQPIYKQTMTLQQARSHALAPLRQYDREYYTIRLNTFRRNEQLLVSLNHHSRCEGVVQIQVVWCDPENDPPQEVVNHDKVVMEYHKENTLNERFHILVEPPTVGVLSMDDDIMRPCEALDAAFFKWTRAPNRMVGFDSRVHVENPDGKWTYGFLSNSEKSNTYSIALTRMSFLHRDYLNLYMTAMPPPILSTVSQNLNCEDIAMSFFTSSLTNGDPPLLADFWTVKTRIKLFSNNAISGNHDDHKAARDACVDLFAEKLELKSGPTKLKIATLRHSAQFRYGLQLEGVLPLNKGSGVERHKKLMEKLKTWNRSNAVVNLKKMIGEAQMDALRKGLIEKTDPWKKRWNKE